jgi:hypothetical protein
MSMIRTLSNYGMLLFGLAVVLNLFLFILAWLRG